MILLYRSAAWAGWMLVLVALLAGGCDDASWSTRLLDGLREGLRCPAVPMRLVLEVEGQRPRTVLTLDRTGEFRVSFGPAAGVRLDPRGCLYAEDGVWVEETRDGHLWTLRGVTRVEDGVLRLGPRGLRILKDGRVVEDPPEDRPGGLGDFRFEGFEPRGGCAARILLQAFLSMMPSMAVSDGHPVALPPPADSVCPDRHLPPGEPPPGSVPLDGAVGNTDRRRE